MRKGVSKHTKDEARLKTKRHDGNQRDLPVKRPKQKRGNPETTERGAESVGQRIVIWLSMEKHLGSLNNPQVSLLTVSFQILRFQWFHFVSFLWGVSIVSPPSIRSLVKSLKMLS